MAEGISELRRTWESAAAGWSHWERTLSASLADATEALLDAAAVGPGMRVLDLACGAGDQTLKAAARVGPDGAVVAADISATMLAHVRENAERVGLSNVETRESAAEELDCAGGSFDAAICRLGLMLFAAPDRALQTVLPALGRGARFAALVFTIPAENPFMSRPMAILLKHAGKAPPAPGQPGIFALGGDGVLEGLLRESGFADVRTRRVAARLTLPDASTALRMMQEAFGAYRAVIADLGEDEQAQAWAEVRAFLGELERGGRFETDLNFIIGSGARLDSGPPAA